MFKTNAIKVVAFLGLLLAFVACGPSKEDLERMERSNYVKQAIDNAVAVDTVFEEIEKIFDANKQPCLKGQKSEFLQALIDLMYVLEKNKHKRFIALMDSVPSGSYEDGRMYEDVQNFYLYSVTHYSNRLDELKACSAYMQNKTKENKDALDLIDTILPMHNNLSGVIANLKEKYRIR